MKKKTLNKIQRAFEHIEKATELLNDADDELFFEETVMLTRNMTVQDTIREMYKTCKDLEFDLKSTINAIK